MEQVGGSGNKNGMVDVGYGGGRVGGEGCGNGRWGTDREGDEWGRVGGGYMGDMMHIDVLAGVKWGEECVHGWNEGGDWTCSKFQTAGASHKSKTNHFFPRPFPHPPSHAYYTACTLALSLASIHCNGS